MQDSRLLTCCAISHARHQPQHVGTWLAAFSRRVELPWPRRAIEICAQDHKGGELLPSNRHRGRSAWPEAEKQRCFQQFLE
jgi:hypothetical protein